jgi:hypothetical protein
MNRSAASARESGDRKVAAGRAASAAPHPSQKTASERLSRLQRRQVIAPSGIGGSFYLVGSGRLVAVTCQGWVWSDCRFCASPSAIASPFDARRMCQPYPDWPATC